MHLNTGSFLLSATGLNGGLVSYTIGANGAVGSARDHVLFSQNSGAAVSGMLETVTQGSGASVLLGGGHNTAMVHYGLAANGTLLSGVATTANSAGTSAITSAMLYSDTVYYTVAQNSGQVM